MRLWRSRCERRGHDWFPGIRSEFLALSDVCLRCPATRVTLPWGYCLNGGHPLAEHYNRKGEPVPHPTCPGPR